MPSTGFQPPLAALTTVFTPPCGTTTWLLTTTKLPSQIPPFPTGGPSSCNPPEWDTYLAAFGFDYYSPAVCPDGFAVGPSCGVADPRTSAGFPPLQDGETAAYCVPSGQVCTSDTTDFSGGVWGWLPLATDDDPAAWTVGPAIQIRWREQDLSILQTDPLTPGLSPQQTSPSSTTTAAAAVVDITTAAVVTSTISPQVSLAETETVVEDPSPSSFQHVVVSAPSSSSSSSASQDGETAATSAPGSSSTTSAASDTAAAEGTSGASNQGGTTGSSSSSSSSSSSRHAPVSGVSLTAIILTAILLAMAQGYVIFMLVRRYRRHRYRGAGDGVVRKSVVSGTCSSPCSPCSLSSPSSTLAPPPPLPPGSGTLNRIWGRLAMLVPRWARVTETAPHNRNRDADAELGTDGPLTELDAAQPLGSRENPAELGDGPVEEPVEGRWSWMSRMSRMFNVR